MKPALVMLVELTFALTSPAQQQPVNVNFNLVQVNHYHGQDSVTAGVTTPGRRVVIDLRNPLSVNALRMSSDRAVDVNTSLVKVTSYSSGNDPATIDALNWESSKVLYSPAGEDSFLVTASRKGCPGT